MFPSILALAFEVHKYDIHVYIYIFSSFVATSVTVDVMWIVLFSY